MHYFVGVIIPKDTFDIVGAVSRILAPFDENEASNGETHWDWWKIGGRWDGVLRGKNIGGGSLDYNVAPIKEYLENIGANDKLSKCINKMLNESFVLPYAVVTPEEGWQESDGYVEHKNEWHKKALALLKKYEDSLIVCVDCHC